MSMRAILCRSGVGKGEQVNGVWRVCSLLHFLTSLNTVMVHASLEK